MSHPLLRADHHRQLVRLGDNAAEAGNIEPETVVERVQREVVLQHQGQLPQRDR